MTVTQTMAEALPIILLALAVCLIPFLGNPNEEE